MTRDVTIGMGDQGARNAHIHGHRLNKGLRRAGLSPDVNNSIKDGLGRKGERSLPRLVKQEVI